MFFDGIGLIMCKGLYVYVGEEIILFLGLDISIVIGKSLLVSVVEKISLFVFKVGIKLFFVKGKVEV